jgi:hypothetical protein
MGKETPSPPGRVVGSPTTPGTHAVIHNDHAGINALTTTEVVWSIPGHSRQCPVSASLAWTTCRNARYFETLDPSPHSKLLAFPYFEA